MINWFEKINYYYNTKTPDGERLWIIDQVKVGVEKGKITPEQFKEITSQDYIN